MTKPKIDTYISKTDGTPVVHVDTLGMPENELGPILRVYINDDIANPVYNNPDGWTGCPKGQHKVWFRWGSGREDKASGYTEHGFDSHAELNAFLLGVEAATGWLDSEQFDSEQDAKEWKE